MKIDVRVSIDALAADFGKMQRKQLPFARRWAVNAVTKDIAQATRNRIPQVMRTSPQGLKFLLNHVRVLGPSHPMFKIHGSAVQGEDRDARGVVGVVPPEGKGSYASWSRYRGSLLPMLEAGGATPGPRPFGGMPTLGRFAIPVVNATARPRMPLNLFPINLGLQARRGISGPLQNAGLRGKRRTYLVPILNAPGTAMIFQRYGRKGQRGSDDTTMPIFSTQQRQTRLPARRYFFPTVDRIVATRLSMHFKRAMEHALFGRGTYHG